MTVTMVFIVKDMSTHEPINNATVRIGNRSCTTDSDGTCSFELNPQTYYGAEVTAPGYKRRVVRFHVGDTGYEIYAHLEKEEELPTEPSNGSSDEEQPPTEPKKPNLLILLVAIISVVIIFYLLRRR